MSEQFYHLIILVEQVDPQYAMGVHNIEQVLDLDCVH